MRTALGMALALVAASAANAQQRQDRLDVEAVQAWVQDLRSSDSVAREIAARQLIETGPRALAFVKPLLDQDLGPSSRLAAERVYSGMIGLSLPEARETATRLDAALAAEGGEAISTTAKWVLEQGDRAIAYSLRQLEANRHPRASMLHRRIESLDAVRDLAAGDNFENHAGKRLDELGPATLWDLSELARDGSLPSIWRAVAGERLVGIGGPNAFDPAMAAAGAPGAPLDVLLPYLCTQAPVDRLADLARVVMPASQDGERYAASLAEMADRLDPRPLVSLLDDGDVPGRCFAARLLGLRREDSARNALSSQFHRRADPHVMSEALVALGRIGNDEDLGLLARALGHEEAGVRRSSLRALASFPQEKSVAWCATALRDSDVAVRAAAIRQLGRRGDDRVVHALIACLDDPEKSVVSAASSSLQRLTGERLAVRSERGLRPTWRDWWAQRQAEAAATDDDEDEEDDEKDLAHPLAVHGHRILDQLEGTLRAQFRPYGDLQKKKGTDKDAFREVALERMKSLLEHQPEDDEEKAENPALEMDEDAKAVVRHLLDHGQFRDAADLAECVGALPIEIPAQDYIRLVYGAAGAMVSSLGDRFTRLSMMEDASGKVDEDSLPSLFGQGETNGLMLDKTDSGVSIEFVFAGSTAERAGLRHGDKLITVDGELASGMKASKLAKKVNEETALTVLRDGWSRPVRFTLTPEVPTADGLVRHAVLPGNIGYVRLREFELGCAQQLEWALRELEKQGIQGLVFDLRGNPGGTVADAVAIVDKFVGKGETITTMWTNSAQEGKDHEEEKLESSDSETDRSYPVAVLVNKNSASASEMTSGALQDLERATVVGRTSWGKGIGQSGSGIMGFPRDSVFGETFQSMSLGITILEYYLPTGRSIQGTGVEPDVPVLAPTLLGERFELMQRVRLHPSTAPFLDEMIAADRETALRLAAFDEWDPDAYEGFEEWSEGLRVQLADDLIRRALRAELRARLAADHPELMVVDVQEDEDLRAAIASLAEPMGLNLEDFLQYEDLAD